MLAMQSMIAMLAMIAQAAFATSQEEAGYARFAWGTDEASAPTHAIFVAACFGSQWASAGGAHVVTLRPVPHPPHSIPPALPVTAITPARENYHCLVLLEPDNGERNHAF